MRPAEQWIWLPSERYPQQQTTLFSQRVRGYPHGLNYTVARFFKCYQFRREIARVELRFSGDTAFFLNCNGVHVAGGPALPGGDFLPEYANEALPQHYASEAVLHADRWPGLAEGKLDFDAQVRMGAARCFDYSRGHGGFFLTAHIRFADGTMTVVQTDSGWSAQYLPAYTAPGCYDNRIRSEPVVPAETVLNVWNCETSPIPVCTETRIEPQEGGLLEIPAGEKLRVTLTFDRIYAGYLTAQAWTRGLLDVTVYCREMDETGTREQYLFDHDGIYRGQEMHSAGSFCVEAENHGTEPARISLAMIASHYPVTEQAKTTTSDGELNLVLDVCTHTLKYCRQSIHLDSPRHCELLACTGDYYIETLMTAFSFGDMRLAAFDVRRTAELLRYRDGRMFHTTYSLIWVQMLWDVYRLTGERALLADCFDALVLLLERFHSYLGENGIIETPPDYMFIDWLNPDGINMHHPPKALGQTCMNLYYYGALKTAVEIGNSLGEYASAHLWQRRMAHLQNAVYETLYDPQRQLFFEGLNTPTPEELLGVHMPQNVGKRYYRKHANILAAYFGFFSREVCADLLCRILEDDSLGQVQPYFAHFLLEAVYRNGLREKYTLQILEQWKAPVQECAKGLAEGFYKPEPNYSFDHSHAWGGTPAYALPLALSGLEILEPGCRRIRLNPSLLGLESAGVEIPTPYGMVELTMQAGEETKLVLPDGIILEA